MADPTTAKCSRCGDEPRAGSSGWGRKCIASRMREMRAARRPVVNTAHGADESAEALRRSAAIEAGRARQAAWRAERANVDQENA
jgi:hypothetical protein